MSPWDPSPGKVCRAPPAMARAQPRWRRASGTLTRKQLIYQDTVQDAVMVQLQKGPKAAAAGSASTNYMQGKSQEKPCRQQAYTYTYIYIYIYTFERYILWYIKTEKNTVSMHLNRILARGYFSQKSWGLAQW